MLAARQAGNEPGARRPLADYYVYPLPERTTVADNQTKQVGFLDAQGVAARKVYEYSADWFQTLNGSGPRRGRRSLLELFARRTRLAAARGHGARVRARH